MKRTLLIALSALVVAAGIFYGIRGFSIRRSITQELENPPQIIPALATTNHLEILPLYEESSARPDLLSGHGVSYLVRTDSATLLLDVGNNPDQQEVAPFMQNLLTLGIDFGDIDRVVISHLHPDHIGGLTPWRQGTLSLGELPGGIDERLVFVPDEVRYKGAIHATIATLPAPDVATTAAIPYLEPWPLSLRNPKGYEQALVVHLTGKGLVLITGCGHPTLEKLVERAESLYGSPVVGVVGGLQCGSKAEDVQPHIAFLQSRSPVLVALSPHDSSPDALAAFKKAFGESYHTLQVGEMIRVEGN